MLIVLLFLMLLLLLLLLMRFLCRVDSDVNGVAADARHLRRFLVDGLAKGVGLLEHGLRNCFGDLKDNKIMKINRITSPLIQLHSVKSK